MIVLFDLDGTLTDSALAIRNSFHHTCDEMGVTYPTEQELVQYIGPPLEETFLSMLGDHDLATMAVTIYRDRYARFGMAETFLYDGIVEAVDELRAAGHTLAVATSKDEIAARLVLDHFSIADRFGALAGAARDGSRHHKADVIAEALRLLGHDPEAPPPAVMIGDRHHDVAGARRFGIDTIGVNWGFGSPAEFEQAGARWQVDQPQLLVGLIASII